MRDYIPAPWEELPAEHLDGVEVHNAANDDLANLRAQALADKHGLIAIAGSDAHTTASLGRAGVAFNERVRGERELVDALRGAEFALYIPE